MAAQRPSAGEQRGCGIDLLTLSQAGDYRVAASAADGDFATLASHVAGWRGLHYQQGYFPLGGQPGGAVQRPVAVRAEVGGQQDPAGTCHVQHGSVHVGLPPAPIALAGSGVTITQTTAGRGLV